MQKGITHHSVSKAPGCVLKDLKRSLQQAASLARVFAYKRPVTSTVVKSAYEACQEAWGVQRQEE